MSREVDEYTQGWRRGQWGTVLYANPHHRNKKPKLDHIPDVESWKPAFIKEVSRRTKPDNLSVHPPGCVWVEEDYVFVGFNTPRIKVPPLVSNYGPRSIYDMGRIEWEQQGFPYLPYLSIDEKFDGRLLRRLAIDRNHFPTNVSASGLITLDKKLVDAWARLETNFLRLIDIYKQRTKFRGIKFLPLPGSRKLYEEYKSKEKLVRDALAIRDRFLILCAVLSFFVSIRRDWAEYERRMDPCSSGDVRWWLQFQAEPIAAGVHSQWVTMILDSSIVWGRRGVKRRGVFIDFGKSEFSVLAKNMIEYGVPVVLRIKESSILNNVDIALQQRLLSAYHSLNSVSMTVDDMNKHLRRYIPPSNIIRALRDPLRHQHNKDCLIFQVDHSAIASGGSTSREPVTSEPPVLSAAFVETREEFLARRDREKEVAIREEGEATRHLRLKREKSAKDFQMPLRRWEVTTKVFFWEFDGTSDVRKLVNPEEYEIFWKEFDRSEMRYDSVRDEWDIWRSGRPEFSFCSDGMGGDEDIAAHHFIDGETVLVPDYDKNLFRDDLLHRLDLNFEWSNGHYLEATRITHGLPFMERMAVWYGYSRDAELREQDKVKIPNKLDYDRLRHALHDSISRVDKEHLDKIQQFFASLMAREGRPPALHDTFGASFSSFGNPRIVARRSCHKAKEFDDPKSPLIALYSVEVLDELGRLLPDRKGRRLFVWNATTALAAKRLPVDRIGSADHLAGILLEHGIPYIFAIPSARLTRLRYDVRVTGLGAWTSDIKENDPLDFKAYLMKIRELFSILRIRKFLRYGGIIWRLARLHLDIYDGLDGPSFEALNEPQYLEGPGGLVDDGVSKSELETLIGTFEVIKSTGGKESVRYSYWPPPYIWSSKGHNVGPWSPDNEDWFTRRFQLYMSGRAQLYTVDEWRTRAGGFTETKVMMSSLEEISKTFIGL